MRVVVVDHNGADLTLRCLESLRRTAWPPDRLELVLVDNSSRPRVAERIAAPIVGVRLIDPGGNRGFAGGCNLAMEDLGGIDYVALVNNDAQVEPGWLRPLVEALEADPGLGAASPRILFADRFVDVHLSSVAVARGHGDRRLLGVRLSGVTVDGHDAWGGARFAAGFWGLEHGSGENGPFQWTDGEAHLLLPTGSGSGPRTAELRLAADAPITVVLRTAAGRTEHRVGPVPTWCPISLDGRPFDLVNNVGSVILEDGHGADRGYLERDEGQYDEAAEIFAWCGAAVLLSRRYLETVGRFEDRFFLYYEDFDLSWRGRAEGWRYLYVPDSVVRHVHSASSVEGSRLFQHYDERNRLLALTRNAPAWLAVREAGLHLFITASYARRDILAPLVNARPVSGETVRRRLRAYGAYLRVVPEAVADRRRLAGRGRMTQEELTRWVARR